MHRSKTGYPSQVDKSPITFLTGKDASTQLKGVNSGTFYLTKYRQRVLPKTLVRSSVHPLSANELSRFPGIVVK